MNSAVEIHDTTLAGIEFVGRDVVLRFAPAYVHRSAGRPGIDPGSGWLQDLDLVISEAALKDELPETPCWLADGILTIGATCWENEIPLPLHVHERVSLSAVTGLGEQLIVIGAGAEIVDRGEPRYLEQFPGTETA